MRMLLGGRGSMDKEMKDTKGVNINFRLFLRPRKNVQWSDDDLWFNEVIGMHGTGADPVKVYATFFQKNEGWPPRTVSLGAFRFIAAHNLCRCGAPAETVSSFIGHVVNGFDNKASDRRIKDYAYALGHRLPDMMRVMMIVGSN